jgi:SH3 domain-binding glutamic acid-rich protein
MACVVLQIKRKQDFVLSVLASRKIPFEEIDISDPMRDWDKKFMREHSRPASGETCALPPQIFNDDVYCGVSSV